MDDTEFRKLLDLFPVVRSRDYHAESEASTASTSQSAANEITSWQDAWEEDDKEGKTSKSSNQEGSTSRQDAWEEDDKEAKTSKSSNKEDAFWKKLRLATEKKLNREEAESFIASFQRIHKKLVFEKLSPNAARNIFGCK